MHDSAIAIIGMAGRFPGARNLAEFWHNLRDGVESVRRLSDADLIAAGVTPAERSDPQYVKAAAVMEDVAMFDASFFGFSPRDAAIMDPQHRHFLECAWEALEDAGHPPESFHGSTGIFAGSGINTYLFYNLLANARIRESAGLFQLKQTGNDKDVLATRVSYQLNLCGPSINLQTACSTSLVAVHVACQSLLNRECDLALAGGVSIEIPHGRGYLYHDGEILSRDGHCRAFDAASSGTVFGSGLGIVVLRRLKDAIADRDYIRAIVLGSAINNDSARKVGFLAPSVEGQAEVIAEAIDMAGITANDVSYVETHGTGTTVGDPIEVRALTQAFRHSSARNGYCGIGSLKTNIGHLDAAAGIAGLIKTVLSLEQRLLPPSLHFEHPNPLIEFKESPFFVNSRLTEWNANGCPRRAGVTSLGIGGTNAHVILEEAPPTSSSGRCSPYQLLTVSAKTELAATRSCAGLALYLGEHPEENVAEVAFTCQLGRQAFAYRRAIVVEDTDEARRLLSAGNSNSITRCPPKPPSIAFMFSGQGSQYVNMGRDLYQHEAVFRETLDLCAARLQPSLGLDLRNVLYPSPNEATRSGDMLNETWLTQPALFAIEYSLARWWMSLGIEPEIMAGHSIGEYVAACLAGVFTLEDALDITAYRGRLIFGLPPGSMLAVSLPPHQIHVNGSLSIAAINNPEQCVISGPTPAIAELEDSLARKSVSSLRLRTSHAFHSAMMDPILTSFVEYIQKLALQPPRIPYLSNVTGTSITPEDATSPGYWARHLRQTVRFSQCLDTLRAQDSRILLEIGPGNTLASLARKHALSGPKVFSSLPHPGENISDLRFVLRTLGQIWESGGRVEWAPLHSTDSARRVSLPAYPFEHRQFWINPDDRTPAAPPSLASAKSASDPTSRWLYHRVRRSTPLEQLPLEQALCWVLFADTAGVGDRVASQLKAKRQTVITVTPGDDYRRLGEREFSVRPGVRSDYDALVADLLTYKHFPKKIVHLWAIQRRGSGAPLEQTLDRCFYSSLFLTQALTSQDLTGIDISVVSNQMEPVSDSAVFDPARAVLLGPVRVLPQEFPGIEYRAIDIDLDGGRTTECAAEIVSEMATARTASAIAYRGGKRFVEQIERFTLPSTPASRPRLRAGGSYLITGGLGAIGLTLANHLVREFKARVVLVSRSAPPENEKLRELRALGADLLVLQADVTKADQMQNVVEQTLHRFGELNGVFHAAGVLEDGPAMLKTKENTARVLDPKVRGTLVLEEVLRDLPLDCFVLFSSISSILPPAGQVDYAAANAFLDAFAATRKSPVIAINWGRWRDLGLGARFLHPLLEHRLSATRDEDLYSASLSAQRHWVLSEHKLKTGEGLLPGTAYLELATAAFTRGSVKRTAELQDVCFLSPLALDGASEGPQSKSVRVHLRRDGKAFRFSVLGQERDWVEHASGSIRPLASKRPSPLDRANIAARCRDREITFDSQHRTKQERYFDFGPRWRSLKTLQLGKREGLAILELGQECWLECSSWLMHPALLDMATGCALYLLPDYSDSPTLYLPFSYDKIRAYSPLPPKLYSHIRLRSTNAEAPIFDITLFDEDGGVLIEAEGFTMRRIADPSALSVVSASAHSDDAGLSSNPTDSGESLGIPPQEGVRTLVGVLRADASYQVIVTPQPIGVQDVSPTASASSQPNALQPPSHGADEVEAALIAWWRDLLGVEQLTLDDDFFDLGGHSLIAVRLINKIKKAYELDLALTALFEARTIRQLSQLIRASRAPVDREASVNKAPSHLVPIQPEGSRPPLFLIHALGSSLLFYNSLAKYLEPDQPVYGVQSLFVVDRQASTATVEELASTYLRDIENFLPDGPYLLGGSSFGGLIALEMSQQLHTRGKAPRLLLLFDTHAPGSIQGVAVGDQVFQHWWNLRRYGLKYLLSRVGHKTEYWGAKLLECVMITACSGYKLIGLPLSTGLRNFEVEQIHKTVMQRYQVQPYTGKLTLFRALDVHATVGSRHDPGLGWQKFARGGLEIHNVPGEHQSMFREPNAKILAEKLKTILAD
jgi:acyl transferase domain-containing protein/thioesterase domain-containing protein